MLYLFKRLKSLTHRQCTYAVIRTEPAKGQCRKKFLSRAHEVASRSHEMLSRGNERTSRAHELNYFPHGLRSYARPVVPERDAYGGYCRSLSDKFMSYYLRSVSDSSMYRIVLFYTIRELRVHVV